MLKWNRNGATPTAILVRVRTRDHFSVDTTQMSGIMPIWMSSIAHPLTALQKRVADVFRRRSTEGGAPPTLRELCREFGWSSTGTARDHVRALVQKGVLHAAAGRSRGACLGSVGAAGRPLPLVGHIVAGRPIAREEHVEREVFVPEEFVPRGKAFLLQVNGDSMEGVGILDRDLVIVRQTKSASSGSVVAVTHDGESTLKLLVERRNKWFLVAANQKYAPIEIESPAIVHGVATALLRSINNGNPKIVSWARGHPEGME